MPQKSDTKPEGCGGAQDICLLDGDADYYGMVLTYSGFPGGLNSKKSTCNAGDLGSIPGLGRSPGEGNSNSLQYSDLENSMDCIVHGVSKSRTQLSYFHFTSLLTYNPYTQQPSHNNWMSHHLLNKILEPCNFSYVKAFDCVDYDKLANS